jgi:hypothetical protein
VVPVKSREFVVAGALLILVTYTLALSLGSQVFAGGSVDPPSNEVNNTGIVATSGIGVYNNSECTTKLEEIDWGVLEPGSSNSRACYIHNDGSSPSTLNMSTDFWKPPEARDYLTLSWDYGNQSIDVDEGVPVTFTLDVDASIEGITDFEFQIIIDRQLANI